MSLPLQPLEPRSRKLTEAGLEYFKDRTIKRLKGIKRVITEMAAEFDALLTLPEVPKVQLKSLLKDIKEQRVLMGENLSMLKDAYQKVGKESSVVKEYGFIMVGIDGEIAKISTAIIAGSEKDATQRSGTSSSGVPEELIAKAAEARREADRLEETLRMIRNSKTKSSSTRSYGQDQNSQKVKPTGSSRGSSLCRDWKVEVTQEPARVEQVIPSSHKNYSSLSDKLHILSLVEPFKFNGDASKFPIFREEIRSHLEDGLLPDSYKKSFLKKFLEGEALQVVEGNLALSYVHLIELLEERFGSPVAITEAWVKKLTEGPKLGLTDHGEYSKFSDAINTACKVLGKHSIREINSKFCLRKIVDRLPFKYQQSWIKRSLDLNGNETIVDLARFVEGLAKLHRHPVYSSSGQDSSFKSSNNKFRENTYNKSNMPFQGNKNFSPNKASVPSGSKALATGTNSASCSYCKQKLHDLPKCTMFQKLPPEQRLQYVKEKSLCFGCLDGSHKTKGCMQRLKCDICTRKHPTCLHREDRVKVKGEHTRKGFKVTQNNNNNYNNSDNKNATPIEERPRSESSNARHTISDYCETTSLVMPIVVYNKNCPQTKIETYALLDDGSDSCFIQEGVIEKLQLPTISTQLKVRTLVSASLMNCHRVKDVIIVGTTGEVMELPGKLFGQAEIPCSYEDIPTPDMAMRYRHLKEIAGKISPLRKDLEIGLLIGHNCPEALCPLQVLQGNKGEPYGVRTALGWGIIGPKREIKENAASSFRIGTSLTQELINPWLRLDFPEKVLDDRRSAMSVEDRRFLKILEENVKHREDMHYELPLPFKTNAVSLPNNKTIALRRLYSLKSKFEKNEEYRSNYVKFVEDMIKKGHAEPVPKGEAPKERTWYIPHHGVYHPRKPGKIRVVYDCSAIYRGVSLNSLLLSGPDLTRSIIRVLMRFREGYVAVCGDIEGMFHQVGVQEKDRDYLRFLWWEGGDTSSPIKEYRMTVHLFGASSSPGCSNFALKQTGKDNEATIGAQAAQFVRRDFYVDDGCASLDRVSEAIQLLKDVRIMCSLGGFRFHKIISNNREVLLSVPPEERAVGLKDFDPVKHPLPNGERILGVPWDVEEDVFKVQVSVKDKPPTRRNILSEICSIHDPLGFVAPYVQRGKAILQDICRELRARNLDCWDERVGERFQQRWQEWRTNISKLNEMSIPRCYKPPNFGNVNKIQVHVFSDASSLGYGVAAYLRLLNDKGNCHCSFIMGKARVCPLKPISIPRLELTAAVVAARIGTVIRNELTFEEVEFYYWTDSRVVLGYIKNESRRYQIFVANRVQEIRELTDVDRWHYVSTKDNPADIASRGPTADTILRSCWIKGPQFLRYVEEPWKDSENLDIEIIEGDPEVKVKVCNTSVLPEYASLSSRLGRYGSWKRARSSIALVIRYIKLLKSKAWSDKKIRGEPGNKPLTPEELRSAETIMIKLVQEEAFAEEFRLLQSKKMLGRFKRNSRIGALCPILDETGILRVGGRLKICAVFNEAQKHPIILPGDHHLTRLLVRHYHEEHHLGRSGTINRLRSQGYWVTRCSTVVKSLISHCVMCQRARGHLQVQKMADLPIQRLEPIAPFTHSAVDCFGPYMVKEGRKHLKRYGVIFTCLACRAVYLDVADSLSTDSFINALRRFLASKGPIVSLKSDLGTNFVGTCEELKKCISEIDSLRITHFLSQQFCSFEWNFNVPRASHMNGVVERQIGTVRRVLDVILMQNPGLLTEDGLRTFFKECERVVNDRPLSVTNIFDPQSVEPLTPNHAILMNAKPLLPPPGSFDSGDIYVRKRWRRIQFLANEFWSRWKREYLPCLQPRKKWRSSEKNLREGDVVLCQDDNVCRGAWPMARVARVHPSHDGLVRKVTLQFSNGSKLDRPIHKTVLLVRFPLEEPGGSD